MPRSKVVKKQQPASELSATNGNDGIPEEGVADVATAIKQPTKSKARGKKAPTATTDGDMNVAREEDEVVVKKTVVRSRKKPVEKVEAVAEESEPPKLRGRAKKSPTEVSDAVKTKAKTTKQRVKKEKTPAPEEPEVSKGRAKKVKTPLNEKAAIVDVPIKEEEPKARSRKKEAEKNDIIETDKQPEPVKGRSKKVLTDIGSKGRAKKVDAVTEVVVSASTTTAKRVRGTKRLADSEISDLVEADEEPEPEVPLVGKKRTKLTKINNENVEAPVKKRGKKSATDDPQQETPSVEAPITTKKRAQKKVNDKLDAELNLPETKPARSRKRAAANGEEDADAIAIDEGDGSRTSKAKKQTTQQVDAYDKSLFTSPTDKEFNLKISSWNVAGLRAWLKKDGLRFVDCEQPDIFCLQETKCANDQLPDEMARLPGYHPYWLCMPGGYAGVAIYSKIMPINVEYGIGNKDFDDVGRMITAEYEKFYLINVYVPNSGRKLVNLEMRMRWEELFKAYVQKLDALKPIVICGDMNVSHSEIDLANPKTNTRNAGFTKEEREKMSELLALGYVDTFRHFYPKQTGAYTFWTYMSNSRARNVGWRLDYCIVSERFVPRIVDNVMRSQCLGSDHCPITVFLNI
ncbi:recombination repair protein 1 isoform X2 [Drosophila hydei]|uniref:DNA-(apurinic or apyrimidinic site) endonuclease n=1 Tax=Drosophila hydei TaxID=7224 RepID=A0A6J1MAN3_DROHY|nr:recombination repair protein 1 isoform X2 [Drosophila hydei]